MKNDLQKVAQYLIREWLAFVVIFGLIALVFQDVQLLGWAMLGAIAGKWWRDN